MYIPPGFSTVTPYFFVEKAEAFVQFLINGLGGREICRTLRPDGQIANVQVLFGSEGAGGASDGAPALGSSAVMVSEASANYPAMASAFYLYVEDADAAMARALAHGGQLEMAVANMPYGDRQGGVRDAHGNIWWISQRLVEAPYEP
jgi:PhnB protein